MLRGTELILFVRAQNQASATLRRVATDVRALTHAQDLQARSAKLSEVQTRLSNRRTGLQNEIKSLQTGEKFHKLQARSLALTEKRRSLEQAAIQAQNRQKDIADSVARVDSNRAQMRRKLGDLDIRQAGMIDNLAKSRLKLEDRILRKELQHAGVNTRLMRLYESQRKLRQAVGPGFDDPKTLQGLPRKIRSDVAINTREIEDAQRQFTDLDRSISSLKGNLASLPRVHQDALQQLQTKRSGLRADLDNAVRSVDRFKRQLETAVTAENTAIRKNAQLATSFRALADGEVEAANRAKALASELDLVDRQIVRNIADQTALKEAQRLQRFDRAAQIGRTASHVGRAAQFGGLVGTAALGGAASVAAEFDTLTTKVATQSRDLDGAVSQIAPKAQEISQEIIDMMQLFPASQQEMSASAYEIFSSINLMGKGFDENGNRVKAGVVNMNLGFDLMEKANQVAIAKQGDLEVATSSLITVLNTFGGSLDDQTVTKTLDTMFSIMRFGRIELAEFDQMMNRIAPAALGAGQSLRDVGGAMAFLTSRLPSTSQVSTGIARLLQAFQHPDFIAGMEAVGTPITIGEGADKKLKPLDQVLETIIGRFPELEKGGVEAENFFRRITQAGKLARTGQPGTGQMFTEFGRRAFSLMAKDMDAVRASYEQVTVTQGEFDKNLQAMMQTQGVQWKIFVNQLRAAVLVIGQEAIPHFVTLGRYIQRGVAWFRDLSAETKRTIVQVIAFVAIGSLLGGILLSIGGGFVALVATLGILTGGFGSAGGAAGRLLGILKLLGAIGVISIAIRAFWTGDVSARELLMSAIAGAATGFAIGGPLGALIAGIVVPIAIKVIADSQAPGMAGAIGAFKAYVKAQGGIMLDEVNAMMKDGSLIKLEDFRKNWIKGISSLNLPSNLIADQTKENWLVAAEQALDAGKITARQFILGMQSVGFSPEQWLAEAGRQAVEAQKAMPRTGEDVTRGIKPDGEGGIVNDVVKSMSAAEQKVVDELKGQLSELGTMGKQFDAMSTGENMKKKMDDHNRSVKDAARYQRDFARAIKSATDEAQDAVNSAASNLKQTYDSFLQQNQTAFGALFGGEWLTDEFGQTADQWGIEPALKDLTKDLQMQLDAFTRWNASLLQLAQRGAPAEMVAELKAMGPEAQKYIDALLGKQQQLGKDFVVGQPKGLLDPGNVDIVQRKVDEVGKAMRTLTVGTDQGQVLIPTVIDGKAVNNEEAIAQFRKTGQNLGTFASRAAADAYATTLQKQQQTLAQGGGLNAFINLWKKRQSAIKSATKLDFDSELAQWHRYGTGIAQQIIFGLRDKDVELENAFRQYVSSHFPNFINDAVAKAKTEFKTNTGAAPKVLPKPKPVGAVPFPKAPQGIKVDAPVQVTITPQPGESTQDAAIRAKYEWRQQARRQAIETAKKWGVSTGKGGR